MDTRRALIAVTAGDPCGIGPEVILKALAAPVAFPPVRLVVIGDHAVFERTARRFRRRLPAWQVVPSGAPSCPPERSLILLDCGHRRRFAPGQSSRAAGDASLAYLDRAVRLWREQPLRALVTAPVTKWAIARVRPAFVGQTEYLAGAMGVRNVAMLFVSDGLRVVLLTRHLSLSRVAHAVNQRLLRTTLRLTAQALTRHFGIRRPRLALCGLNPHAGEASGRSEEQTVMRPVLRALRRAGLRCDGPFAADGFFAKSLDPKSRASGRGAERYDAVVCAYHDQGLIPFKMAARDEGCQLSAGLPIVRTSPDHGSALDIAGKGIANPGSMIYALQLAVKLAKRNQVRGD